ncbi:pyroglutamylated RFamide peptide receptor-like, partial [Orbicella faveolata]|uniref:pyroglutamylated RFamide peptide receptor-like n=1 Tax=Orbicella faveolata TaxID=48498 RepID=UPI0009E53666
HPDGVFGVVLCKSVTGGVFAWTGSASAIVTLIAIAIERYYAVMYPHGNKWNLTKRKLKVIIPVTWICAIILNLPLMIVKDVIETKSGNSCVSIWPEDWMGKAYSVAWFVGVFIPLIVMIGLYSRVVYALWFKGSNGSQLTQQQKGVMKVRKRVTLMVVAVTAIFGVCWGTGQLVYVLLYFISDDIGAVLLAISDVMILFNSAVNPFVYALLNHQFREKIKRMICCSLAARVHPDLQDTQLAETTTQPTVGTSSKQ